MKIKSLLKIIVLGIVIASAFFSISIHNLLSNYDKALEKEDVAQALILDVFERRIIAEDYLLSPTKRAEAQWFLKQENLRKDLVIAKSKFHDPSDVALLNKIDQGVNESEKAFTELTAVSESTTDNEEIKKEKHGRLSTLLSVKARETISAATALHDLNEKSANESLQKVIVLFSAAASLFLTILLISFWILGKSAGKLSASEERFQFVVKATNDAIYDWDLVTNKIWFSEGMQKLFGYSKEQIPEDLDWWTKNIHPEDSERVNGLVSEMLKGTLNNIKIEYRFKRADGSYASVIDRAYLSRNASGRAIRYIGVLEDVTSRKDYEEKLEVEEETLREAQAKNEAIFSSIGDGIIVTDEYGKIAKINQEALGILGYREGELSGMWFTKTIRAFSDKGEDVPAEERPMTEALLTGQVISKRMYYLKKDGSRIPVSISVAPVIINEKPIGAVEIFRDITHEKEIEKLKDEFVSLASHELRTPMTAIKGFVSMIEEGDFGPVSPELKEPLSDIGASTERLIHLVNDMLNVSRIEAGRLKFNIADFDIKSVTEEVVSTLTPISKSKNIILETKISGQVMVQGDADKVKQVLNNIIGNSLKFTDKGSILVSSTVEKELVKIFITDTGMGISAEDQNKLFGKFQQISSQQAGKPVGTGLGLYLSRQLLQRMGGNLWIEKSEVGAGSVFAFSLPISGSDTAILVKNKIEADEKNHPDQKSE